MGIIRLVLLVAAIWLAWRLIKQTFLSSKPEDGDNKGSSRDNDIPEAMLRCDQCGVHTPSSQAFNIKGHHFCSAEHQQLWLEQHERDEQ
jgi:uncharacterized protein